MKNLIKKLRDAVNKIPARFDLKFDLSKLADDLEKIDNSNSEIEFTLDMTEGLESYLKKGSILIIPENISAESEIKAILESRDDISYFETDILKNQLSEMTDEIIKLKILKDE